jgi:hypothetical protein
MMQRDGPMLLKRWSDKSKVIRAAPGTPRGRGKDGSIIFLGRQGEGLVVAQDGRIFRGSLGRGIDITANGVEVHFNSLTPLN